MTFSKSLEKAGRIDIGLWLLKSIGSSALTTGITLAILRDSGNTPVGNEVFIMVQEAVQYFGKTDELSSWIYYHVQELCER